MRSVSLRSACAAECGERGAAVRAGRVVVGAMATVLNLNNEVDEDKIYLQSRTVPAAVSKVSGVATSSVILI
ncbi:hypothetical protein AAES_28985 [Amazona aestiva]|uniref:Uncharacterized protein n=1 Tax=Amazona aestiva TaxID=12930 RepID=A0A0Q3S6Q0_AMAAE|nr:hypothetical protein AAES_28985 [Amazona aestiva]